LQLPSFLAKYRAMHHNLAGSAFVAGGLLENPPFHSGNRLMRQAMDGIAAMVLDTRRFVPHSILAVIDQISGIMKR